MNLHEWMTHPSEPWKKLAQTYESEPLLREQFAVLEESRPSILQPLTLSALPHESAAAYWMDRGYRQAVATLKALQLPPQPGTQLPEPSFEPPEEKE